VSNEENEISKCEIALKCAVLSAADPADFLGVHVETVRGWVREHNSAPR